MEIYSSSKYFYFILKPLGLTPFALDLNSGTLQTKLVDFVILSLNLAVLFGLTCRHLTYFVGSNEESGIQNRLLDRLWKYQYVLQHFLAIFAILFNFMKRRKIEKFLLSIREFDMIVNKLGWTYRARNFNALIPLVTIVSSTTIMLTFLTAAHFLVDIYRNAAEGWTYALLSINYTWIHQFFLALSLQFILSVFSIKSRLKALSRNMKLHIARNSSKFVPKLSCYRFMLLSDNCSIILVKMDPTKEKNYLKNIAILYDLIADAVDQINSVFSKQVSECESGSLSRYDYKYQQMIAVFLPAMMLQVFTIYLVIKALALDLPIETWAYFDFTFWNLCLVFPSLVVIYAGATASSKGRKLSNNVGKYLNNCIDVSCADKVRSRII